MFMLNGSHAFWIFAGVELAFLCLAILASRLISPKKPNWHKRNTYECGQEPFGEARTFRILGILKYFGYAVAFFALDAFAWVILTSAYSVSNTGTTISVISMYTVVICTGIAYFLIEKEKMV